jgi:peptidoglycan/LPS O-acetylase OafA/YrhL
MAKTIAALLKGRDNNFNLIRFLAAAAVIVDHSFALVADRQAAASFIDMGALGIGRVAVDVFFIVSGFLVTRSVLTQPTLLDYGVARVLRLFPALFVATVAIAFVLGPIVTHLPLQVYFADPRPWIYVPLTAGLITHTLNLPGVFDGLPDSGVIDPPLWTLRYESFCYGLLALLALLGMLASRRRAGLLLAMLLGIYGFVTFATAWREEMGAVDSAMRFVLAFFIGPSSSIRRCGGRPGQARICASPCRRSGSAYPWRCRPGRHSQGHEQGTARPRCRQ